MAKKKAAPVVVPEAKKEWTITQADIDSITQLDFAFSTDRFLPPEDKIPQEFWSGNAYVRLTEAMMYGEPMPPGEVTFNEGFRPDGPALQRCIMAHLRSFNPKHEHKIAGVAYMISKITHITPILT